MLVRETISFQKKRDPKETILGKMPLKIGDIVQDTDGHVYKITNLITKDGIMINPRAYNQYTNDEFIDVFDDEDLFYVLEVLIKDDLWDEGDVSVCPIKDKNNSDWKVYKVADSELEELGLK